MKPLPTLLALSTAALLTACAGIGPAAKADERAAHQATTASPAATPNAMHERMQHMQAMRDKMMNARTAAERQALMDEHTKVMHEGMATMNGLTAMRHVPLDPARHQQMMEARMDMMQTMMEMMMQRMPGATLPPTGK